VNSTILKINNNKREATTMAQIAIRVKRKDFIDALEARLKAIPKEEKEYKKAQEQYKKDYLAWAKKSVKNGGVHLKESDYHIATLEWSEKALESRPKRPSEPNVPYGAVKDIEQGLKILNLSDEEYVPASVAKNLSYLI
jgi:hypothetical protein